MVNWPCGELEGKKKVRGGRRCNGSNSGTGKEREHTNDMESDGLAIAEHQ